MQFFKEFTRVAKGDIPADLVLLNSGVINVFTGEIQQGNVAVYRGVFVGIGDYSKAVTTKDLEGKILAPGFINGHVHLESSMLDVSQYVRAVIPHGTTTIVTDLHEIANVAGLEGMRYVLDTARNLPLNVFVMAPSCVPSTEMETSGARLDKTTLSTVLRWKNCIGLGEVMNYPGVIAGDKDILEKIDLFKEKTIDGHAPGLTGKDLDIYTGAGITSDHESVTLEEAQEKLERGMYIMIREGSSEKNLEALLPLVNDTNWNRFMFVVDDRSCIDLLRDGDMDAVIRKAIRIGMDPVRAIQLATIIPATYYGLKRTGAVAPGYQADFIVIDDLQNMTVSDVYYRGRLVAENGMSKFDIKYSGKRKLADTISVKPFDSSRLELAQKGNAFPVIEVVPGQIVTKRLDTKPTLRDGEIVPDISRDLLKVAVFERHHATGNIGVGLVKGFGLLEGAIASSVAHDSHNIVVVGTNDDDMLAVVKEIERLRGGLVAVSGGMVLNSLTLPVAGLLSDEPVEDVVKKLEKLEKTVLAMGCKLISPFSVLSFIALPVIPELRVTDLGLVDVSKFELI